MGKNIVYSKWFFITDKDNKSNFLNYPKDFKKATEYMVRRQKDFKIKYVHIVTYYPLFNYNRYLRESITTLFSNQLKFS